MLYVYRRDNRPVGKFETLLDAVMECIFREIMEVRIIGTDDLTGIRYSCTARTKNLMSQIPEIPVTRGAA